MPKGPKGEKRPADTIGAAIKIAKIATDEIEDDKPEDDGKDEKEEPAELAGFLCFEIITHRVRCIQAQHDGPCLVIVEGLEAAHDPRNRAILRIISRSSPSESSVSYGQRG